MKKLTATTNPTLPPSSASPQLSLLDYTLTDLLFAHWLKRKRECLSQRRTVPQAVEERLGQLRNNRNPHASIFIFD